MLFLRVGVLKDGTESWFWLATRLVATLERLADVSMQVQLPSLFFVPLISEVVAQVKEANDTLLATKYYIALWIQIQRRLVSLLLIVFHFGPPKSRFDPLID